MVKIPVFNTCELSDSIVPQVFIKRDGEIIYFDKINPDEGRFYSVSSQGERIFFEIGEGQGIITDSGDLYAAEAGEDTILTKYSTQGKAEKMVRLNGVFFDFKKNDSGDMICLGNIGGKTIIKILNKNMDEIYTIEPKGILFGSCVYVEKDDIYIGGFDNKNIFKLLNMNYIGNIKAQWDVDVDSRERIISKIIRYNEYFFMLVTGRRESIVILNKKDGLIREFIPRDFGLKDFTDFNIYGNIMSILSGKIIYDMNINSILSFKFKRIDIQKTFDIGFLFYIYVMYYGRLEKEIALCFKTSVMVTFLLFLTSYYLKYIDVLNIPMLMLGFSSLWIINFTIASVRNIIAFSNKAIRIEQLLLVYGSPDGEGIRMTSIYMGITALCFMEIISFPDLNIIICTIIGALTFLIFSFVDKAALSWIKKENSGVVIELLNDENVVFKDYIKSAVKCLKEKNSERLSIELVTDREPDKDISWRWFKSRRGIIKNDIKTIVSSNRITTVLDLSKRDIKYSRQSILMDYICFIKMEAGIKQIKIGILDKDALITMK